MIRSALARGADPPKALMDAPLLAAPCEPYWRAFWALNAYRQIGVGMAAVEQALVYTEVAAYGRDHGFGASRGDFDAFLHLMRAMDIEYRALQAEQARIASEQRKAAGGGRPGAPPARPGGGGSVWRVPDED